MYPSAAIRHKEVDGLVVILDLRSGEYVTLNPVASQMWRALTGSTDSAQAAALVADAFAAPADVIHADLREFAGTCLEQGLLALEAAPIWMPPTVGGRPIRPRATRAWQSLFLTTRSLSRHGFARTYAYLARLPRPPAPAPEGRIEAAVQAFARAELAFVIRAAPADCLPRSLALWRFLISVGVPAEHRIGVQRFPFAAHAWTEVDGQVLFDSRERVKAYAEIARL